jgi:transcription elongation factor SPT5
MRKDRDRGRFGLDDEGMDAEEIERYYRNRYNEDTAAIARFGEGGEEMSDEITQQTLLPGVKDPNLWMVKCLVGMEKLTVLRIMNKFIAYQHTEEPLLIRSVVAPEHVKVRLRIWNSSL